jgi:hypothetical protein
MTHWLKFLRWYFTPIQALRALPDGDGAFAAFALSLALYERFVRCDLKYNQGVSASDEAFRTAAAADLGLSYEEFVCFWEIYRNGINHQGSPRKTGGEGWFTTGRFPGTTASGLSSATRQTVPRLLPSTRGSSGSMFFVSSSNSPDILQKSDTYAFGDIY